ncbi:MAG TPA: phospholipase D-like domain-containing protein [Anaerolineales bacterium]|nr:phospholipase D-like domain-containing protein [Anaerolineales bacterium]
MSRRRRISRTNALATVLGLFVLLVIGIFSTLLGTNLGGVIPAASTATLALPPAETFPPPSVDTPVVILPTIQNPVGSWWEVYFTDPLLVNDPAQWQNTIEGRLIEKINAAQNSIHIAAFEFNLTRVADALIAAHNRGLDVRWVTDDEHGLEADEEPDRGQFAMLQQAGIEVRADTRSALMHNKFWIFDSQTVWTGSTNITENAVYKQDNNTIVIQSPAVAAIYEREFQEMWDGHFGPTSPSQLAEQSANVNGTQIWIIFTSEDHALEQAVIPVVNFAQSSVRFLAFSFTDYPLANAMIARAQSGVSVAGVYEKVGSNTEAAEFRTLYCAGVAVRKDGNPSFMHNKVIIVDGRFVITGSMNFSTSAEESNDENVIILDNPEIASLYLQDFDRVWSRAADPEPGSIPCQ